MSKEVKDKNGASTAKKNAGTAFKIKLDIEYVLPILDLYTSLLIRSVNGLHQIDLHAYAE